ncbi:phosphoadenylyl-sulfate reductase [Nannocystis sp.]|uniref:phosphoadenylyl-sulfate reductase n=1 Tax=Nannocystis sp. TaxID=1962667 RepID=UPI0025E44410|nr:phosphoadenylyl-sulfate reductase [Nannocystis sp.]MBK7824159.1 phosphoadenylyl-sulfate reductase [Nannocystis sp.]
MNDVPGAGEAGTASSGTSSGASSAAWFSEPDLVAAGERLEGATALEILAWAFERFAGRRVALSSAFGAEGCALIHLARQLEPAVPVYTIDTGYLFAETIALRDAYRAMGADIRVIEPLLSIRGQAERHGPDLFARDADTCCEIRKVEPMRRILTLVDVWITAVRRDQSETRKQTPIVGTARRSDGSLVVKLAPLARWSRKDTWDHLLAHALPYNRLLDEGYTSIGCQPCTRPTNLGVGVGVGDAAGDERSGRWAGQGKTECGIHHL